MNTKYQNYLLTYIAQRTTSRFSKSFTCMVYFLQVLSVVYTKLTTKYNNPSN